MGHEIAIGLVTSFWLSKAAMERADIDLERAKTMLKLENFALDIYEMEESEKTFSFNIKEDIFAEQLIPFLKAIYPCLYQNPKDYKEIIEQLGDTKPNTWLELSKTKPYQAFMYDKYAESDYLENNYRNVPVNFDSIIISLDGKALMETWRELFRFLTFTMQKTFSNFPLSSALRIYFTG